MNCLLAFAHLFRGHLVRLVAAVVIRHHARTVLWPDVFSVEEELTEIRYTFY